MRLWLALGVVLLASPSPGADVVARRTLPAGTIVTEADVRAADPSAIPAIGAMLGQETRRTIYSGRPVAAADLGPATLVRRNDIVTMRFRDQGLEIIAEGRALDPGGHGERIRVLNLASRTPVVARVVAPSLVEIGR